MSFPFPGRSGNPVGRLAVAGVALALVGLVGLFDVLTGAELSFSVFYLAPVALVAWRSGRSAGLAVSLLAAAVWIFADHAAGAAYANAWIPFWNAAVRLGFFAIVTELLVRLEAALRQEQRFATTDHLTGVANSRAFYRAAEAELERMRRHPRPATVAYLDVDDFKAVNDRLGHEAGDALLRVVAQTIRQNLRAIDTVARLGGDEFALLMPETDADAARGAIEKLQRLLAAAVDRRGWQVTFSLGVLTSAEPPSSVDELVRMADDLMYTVKRGAKNGVSYRVVDQGERILAG